MTVQYFCSNITRHGSLKNGFNLCDDGCHKPTEDTAVYIISTTNIPMNLQSLGFHYRSKLVYLGMRSVNGSLIFFDSKYNRITPGYLKDDIKARKVRGTCDTLDFIKPRHIPMNIDKIRSFHREDILYIYLSYMTTTQIKCTEVLRLGSIQDGGWNVCHDKEYRPSKQCLVYSFGINWDFSFDDAVMKTYGCEIHSFDPSMNSLSFRRGPKSYFHNIGLSDGHLITDAKKKGWKLSAFSNILSHFNHTKTTIDILKIDIEEMEWTVLPNMLQAGVLRNVRQFVIEFHLFGTLSYSASKLTSILKYLNVLYAEGFRIFWYHRNPWSTETFLNNFSENTNCHEIYFVNINLKHI